MSELARYRTALEPFTEELAALASAQLSISEKREHGFITLRGELHSPAVEQDYARLGLKAPSQPLSYTGEDKARLLWVSPDECLLVCAPGAKQHWLERLTDPSIQTLAVIDTSGTYSYLELSGEQVEACLGKVCPYNFGARSFPVGKVVGSVIKGIPCLFVRVEPYRFQVLVRFSFANYVFRLLSHATAEFSQGLSA